MVWPCHHQVVRLFLALGTQWNWLPLTAAGRPIMMPLGLDYRAVEPTARMMGIDLSPEMFGDLRVMETTAAAELSKG